VIERPPVAPATAVRRLARCVLTTFGLLGQRQIRLPKGCVGLQLHSRTVRRRRFTVRRSSIGLRRSIRLCGGWIPAAGHAWSAGPCTVSLRKRVQYPAVRGFSRIRLQAVGGARFQ
jgi:hypothetical protein